MPNPIRYSIVPSHPEAHLFEVRCTIDNPDPGGQKFSLPTWIPGSYLIREFAKHVVRIRAQSGRKMLRMVKLDKNAWQVEPFDAPVTVTMEIYAWDLSVRGAHLDTTHAFFNGPAVFLQVEGREDEPVEVEILAPKGAKYRNWRIATAMKRKGAKPYSFGTYEAANYDDLIDHPVEIGTFTLATFKACGVQHDIAITGRHRASTALLCARNDLPSAGLDKPSSGYRTFLGLASHEYFHTWNIKRIKPAAFMPYELDRENYTTMLWAFEGFTSYYDDLLLVRSGLMSRNTYLDTLGRNVTSLLRTGGRKKQTVAESSFDAWIKYYRTDENTPNAGVSYYGKGSLIGLSLDLLIRNQRLADASRSTT